MTTHPRQALPSRHRGSCILQWSALLQVAMFAMLLSMFTPAQAQTKAEPQPQPSTQQLADLLENEASRNALIAQLRNQAASQDPAKTPAAESGLTVDLTHFLSALSKEMGQAVDTFRSLGTGEGIKGMTAEVWREVLIHFAIVVAITLLAWAIFRWFAAFFYRHWDRKLAAEAEHPELRTPAARRYRNAAAIISSLLVDLAAVALAAVAGYIAAVYLVGQTGEIGKLEDIFIKTFLATEAAKAMVRVIFARRYARLRLLPIPDAEATFWNNWLERLITISSYSILIAVPLVKAMFSPAMGQMLGLFIMLGVYIYALRVVWRNRLQLSERLRQRAANSSAFFGTLLRVLARVWHILAIVYFTVLLGASQLAPDKALPFMAHATIQTLLAVGIALLLSAVLTVALSHRVQLPEQWRMRLPMLERRLNAYVPATLKGLRMVLLFFATLIVLDAWHVFDLSAGLASDRGRAAIFLIVRIGIVLLIATASWTLVASVIEHRLSMSSTAPGRPSARERTLLSLFRNAAMIVIVTMTVLVLLSQIGIDIGPLIAGAGVVGLAIGFGAQKLVQDIITGVFIQLENGMNQNDVVQVAGVFGTVEKLTIRSVGIRTLDGAYHLVPFSSVDTVVNHMRDFSYHVGEYTVALGANVDEAIVHLRGAYEELERDEVLAPELMNEFTVAGVTSLSERGVTIRVLIKTSPGMQWAVQRGYNRLVKKHFDAAGIELPYPHRILHIEPGKNGDRKVAAAAVDAGPVHDDPAEQDPGRPPN